MHRADMQKHVRITVLCDDMHLCLHIRCKYERRSRVRIMQTCERELHAQVGHWKYVCCSDECAATGVVQHPPVQPMPGGVRTNARQQ